MAYGFNLGQIEGLDSSVKTVTAMIANATESNTYTLAYNDDTSTWTDDFDNGSMRLYHINEDVVLEIVNFTESDVGDTYNVTISTSAVEENFKSAVETVLADNGLISESETIFDGTLTLADEELEYELPSDFPDGWYENAVCTVNGMEIPKDPETEYGFNFLTDAIFVSVSYIPSEGEYPAVLHFSYCDVPNDYATIPGDYQVKITEVSESKTDSDNTIYIIPRNGVATMSVDPTVLYDAVNASGTIPRVVVRAGGGAHEINDIVVLDRPGDTVVLTQYSFAYNSIEEGSIANELYFTINEYSFTKGNNTGTVKTTKGTIPFTPKS